MSSYTDEKADSQMHSIERIKMQLNNSKRSYRNEFEYTKWRTESDLYDLIVICNKKGSKWYSEIRKNIKQGFLLSLKCNIRNNDRLRAFLFLINPDIVPTIMKIRKKVYMSRHETTD